MSVSPVGSMKIKGLFPYVSIVSSTRYNSIIPSTTPHLPNSGIPSLAPTTPPQTQFVPWLLAVVQVWSGVEPVTLVGVKRQPTDNNPPPAQWGLRTSLSGSSK